MREVVALTKGIKEAWLSSQIEDIKDELGAVFKAYGKTAKDKVDKVDKTKLLELLAKKVIRIGLPTIPTIQEPIAAVSKLDLKVINLPDNLIFAAQRASKPISGFNAGNKSNSLPNQIKDKHSTYYILADQISIISSRYRSGQDLPI